jgi:hypothetical protein
VVLLRAPGVSLVTAPLKPLDAHIWEPAADAHYVERPLQQWATEIGAAGEHIVCADVLLHGLRAYQSAQGLPYDVVIDRGFGLLRVAIKSTLKALKRPKREGLRLCYQFAVTRSRRLRSGKTDARKYLETDVDIVAFCALNIQRVAYSHIRECAQSMHFDVPDAVPQKKAFKLPRKTFDDYTLARALAVHDGILEPRLFQWKAAL